MKIFPVIMSGGSGSRLWPVSRSKLPKQFLNLIGENSMIQDTALRLQGLKGLESLIVIANNDHRFLIADQLQKISHGQAKIILEPKGRNTAPAVALAAFELAENDPESLMLILSADHVIKDEETFRRSIEIASREASKGNILTFGIVPDRPETGYGYIQRGANYTEDIFDVNCFVEKPDALTADKYLSSGEYYWNSGMFLLRADVFLDELNTYRPDIYESCKNAMLQKSTDLDFVRPDQDIFESCPADSIDYAVMEKSDKVKVLPLDAGWSDVGAWDELWKISPKDCLGNSIQGDVIKHKSEDNYISSSNKLIATVGVNNLVIVESDDAILVASKDSVQDVKKVVEELKAEQRPEIDFHRKVYRPWGNYDSIDEGERFKVKRIVVQPGKKLSLQMHHHRAEHWIVVKGTALVTCGEQEKLLTENESIYIPLGETHRLENNGKIDLEIIEVQSGSYVGEDDIVRFDDVYNRS